jgi:holo-[acyl-carrier protein] synthase
MQKYNQAKIKIFLSGCSFMQKPGRPTGYRLTSYRLTSQGKSKMIKGIGIDIVEINRIEKAITRRRRFVERIFTKSERDYCLSRHRPYLHFAVRFAAKEAALKALGTGMRGMKWTDFEVRRDKWGKPYLVLGGNAATLARGKGICDIFISLSFSRESAIASAIAVGTE